MSAYVLMAFTNALAGKEDEYNHWFEDVHIPEILAVDGFRSVQRMQLSALQRTAGPHPYKYAALYSIETHDLAATLQALGEAVQKGTKTDASDMTRRALWVYEPIAGAPSVARGLKPGLTP
jgi:hypothetical protein